MIYYIAGLCIYGIFDFLELRENSWNSKTSKTSKTREKYEKILFGLIFAAALALGIWYFSAYDKPNLTRGLIDYFGMKNIIY